jgi:hypothetical protein
MTRIFELLKKLNDRGADLLKLSVQPIDEFNYQLTDEYKAALNWYNKEPTNADKEEATKEPRLSQDCPEDSKSVFEYAQTSYKSAIEHYDLIDKKAEWCIASATAGLAAVVAVHEKLGINIWMAVPSLILLYGSAKYALRCRMPGSFPHPMAVSGLLDIHESNRRYLQQAKSLHCTIEGILPAIDHKSKLLSNSVEQFLAAGIALVLAKLITSVFSLIFFVFAPPMQVVPSFSQQPFSATPSSQQPSSVLPPSSPRP